MCEGRLEDIAAVDNHFLDRKIVDEDGDIRHYRVFQVQSRDVISRSININILVASGRVLG